MRRISLIAFAVILFFASVAFAQTVPYIMSMVMGNNSGLQLYTQEYSSQTACQAAVTAFLTRTDPKTLPSLSVSRTAWCSKK